MFNLYNITQFQCVLLSEKNSGIFVKTAEIMSEIAEFLLRSSGRPYNVSGNPAYNMGKTSFKYRTKERLKGQSQFLDRF